MSETHEEWLTTLVDRHIISLLEPLLDDVPQDAIDELRSELFDAVWFALMDRGDAEKSADEDGLMSVSTRLAIDVTSEIAKIVLGKEPA
jgi:hypothetical protein